MAARRRKSALRVKYGAARARVQTLLFPKDWALEDARIWAALHGINADKFDETETHIRVFAAGKKKRAARTKVIPYGPNGLKAAVEWR